MNGITFENVCVKYRANSAPVLRNLSADLRLGAMHVLVGLSGSGKTTLLLALAGLLRVLDLDLFTGSVRVFDSTPEVMRQAKGLGIVFQAPTLIPWLTVIENLRLPLHLGRRPGSTVPFDDQLVTLLGLQTLIDRYPHQLSGGQRQRVALGRALVTNPRLLLLDEPFGNLDEPTREELLGLVRRLHVTKSLTTLLVTHDLVEAARVGDEILVLNGGLGAITHTIQARESTDASLLDYEDAAPIAQRLASLLADDWRVSMGVSE